MERLFHIGDTFLQYDYDFKKIYKMQSKTTKAAKSTHNLSKLCRFVAQISRINVSNLHSDVMPILERTEIVENASLCSEENSTKSVSNKMTFFV